MWFRSLFDALLARSPRTPVARIRRGPRVCPLLEILEDRTLLSTYMVNSLTDTGTGSGFTGDLRYCITHATSGQDTITFGVTGTINLQSPLPAMNASVAITGPGADKMTISGGNSTQVFNVTASNASVTIAGLTITAGKNLGFGGGGITNVGTLVVNSCTLSGNAAYAYGGAIRNDGTLTINNSTVAGNQAGNAQYGSDAYGGAIYNDGALSINSSTLVDNLAVGADGSAGWSSGPYGSGGGYPPGNGFGGGLYLAAGTVTIDHSTFADNVAVGGYGYPASTEAGGGIYNGAGANALQMHDTILADNSTEGGVGPDLYGDLTSLGHNLIGNSTGGSGFAASDLLNANPQLGPLQNNGGLTQTMALLAGSPAINAGDNSNAPAYDQRGPGFPRIVGGTIDIGAFEVQTGTSNQASSLTVAGFPSVITAGNAGSFTVTAKNADGSTDTGYTGSVHFTSSDSRALLPANYTFTAADKGVHTFGTTLKTAGTQSITATDTTTGSITGSDTGINVKPAKASTLSVSGFPSPATAGVASNFTVTLKDAYGNIATGYTGTVHFSSSDAKAVLPANYTFTAADAGVHVFSATLKTAGTQSITAADTTTAGLTGTDGGITVKPAAASKFALSAPSSIKAGVPFSLTITVEDAYGNVVTGFTGTIHFSSSDPTATLPTNYTFTAANNGVHTFIGLVLRKKGYQKITVMDTPNSSLTGSAIVDVL